jgi:hypothetical protein
MTSKRAGLAIDQHAYEARPIGARDRWLDHASLGAVAFDKPVSFDHCVAFRLRLLPAVALLLCRRGSRRLQLGAHAHVDRGPRSGGRSAGELRRLACSTIPSTCRRLTKMRSAMTCPLSLPLFAHRHTVTFVLPMIRATSRDEILHLLDLIASVDSAWQAE